MTDLLLFGLLTAEGLSAGFLYRLLDKARKAIYAKFRTKKVTALITEGVTDVLFVLAFGAGLFLSCFFMSNRMRLSYVLVFVIGASFALTVRRDKPRHG